MDSTAVNTLILIAESQDYFLKHGLSVSTTIYPSGSAAVEGLLKAEVDVATASEFVLVRKAFTGDPVQSWGSIDRFMHTYLIARKDRGVYDVQGLTGKKVGFSFQTSAEFYLGRYLELNGLSLRAISPINIDPANLVQALANGEVDAVATWQPYVKTISDQLGNGVVRWPIQSDQVTYWNLVSLQTWTEANSDAMQKFLLALIDAEAFIANHPQDARAILKKRLSFDDSFMDEIWPEHQFQVSLNQSMVLAMEDEARWMINNQMVPDQPVPAFTNVINTTAMKSVRPNSVNIIP